MRHVELVEARPLPVGLRDLFDGTGACGRKAVGEVQFFRYGCDWNFAERMVDFVDANGGKTYRRGDWSFFLAEWTNAWGEG